VSLELTSGAFAALVIALAVALPVVAVVAWSRVRGHRVVRVAQRWLLVVAAQAAGVLAVLVVINNQFGLYSGWDDLLGRTAQDSSAVVLTPQVHTTRPAPGPSGSTPGGTSAAASTTAPAVPWVNGLPAGFSAYDSSRTFLAMVAVPGSPSPMRLYVALPPEYGQPAYAHKRFPVVELLHGYPGTPTTWFHAMDVRARLAAATGLGATPFVLAIPQISVPGAPDLECTDLPGQPQVATFLTTEVHAILTSHFRVRADRAGWGLMGYSEGGYCAAALTLRHPELYAAGVDIAGYGEPLSAFFDRYPAQRAAGRLAVLLRAAPPVAIYASASAQDPQSSGALDALTRDSRPPTSVTARLYAQGGHNTSDWSAQLPGDFQWLSHELGGVAG
jgi:enterochelin esterase-like enzyme